MGPFGEWELAHAECRTKGSTALLLVVFVAGQETRGTSPVDGRKCSIISGTVWLGNETYIQAEHILMSELVLRLKVKPHNLFLSKRIRPRDIQ